MTSLTLTETQLAKLWTVLCIAIAVLLGMFAALSLVRAGTDVVSAYANVMAAGLPYFSAAILLGCFIIFKVDITWVVSIPDTPRIPQWVMVLLTTIPSLGIAFWLAPVMQQSIQILLVPCAVLVAFAVLSLYLAGIRIRKLNVSNTQC